MSWLSTDKAPFVVTILAGALGWTTQRAVTILTEVPTIAYSVKFNGGEIVATIENNTDTIRDIAKIGSSEASTQTATTMKRSGDYNPEVVTTKHYTYG